MTDKLIDQRQIPAVLEENISFDDFVKRYEGQRVEWHAGKVVEKMTNNENHQIILGFLYNLLSYFLAIKPIGRVYLAGLPMFISDDKPAREPDLMVILQDKFDRVKPTRLEGAADIAVEIVSPGSDMIDRGVKFKEYETAGVREYWLIDPIRKAVDIYVLNNDKLYQRIRNNTHITSQVLPEFHLEIAVLWQDELPAGPALVEIVNGMLE